MTIPSDTAETTTARAAELQGDERPARQDRADEWIDLFLDSDALERRREVFDDAFAQVATAIDGDPAIRDTIRRLVDRRLGAISLQTGFPEITEALRTYLGVDGAYLIHWLVYVDTSERIERVAAIAPTPVTSLLRAVVAEFGATIDLVQRASLTSIKDWRRITKRAYLDELTGRRVFEISVYRLDGTELRLETSPDSLLNLVTHLLELVNAPGTRAVYSSHRLTAFTERLGETVSLIVADDHGPDAGAEPGATEGLRDDTGTTNDAAGE